MKLQIIGRLNKKQKFKNDKIKEIIQGNASICKAFLGKSTQISQYYSTKTENIDIQQVEDKLNLRDFFDNFNSNCEVQYQKVEHKGQKVKRKLEPILQLMRNSTKMKSVPKQQQQKKCRHSRAPSEANKKQNSKKDKQKMRKANSLISIEHEANSSQINSTRKPGFIKLNKSMCKKESSLRNSNLTESNKQNLEINVKPMKRKKQSKCNSKQVDQSMQWISLMRLQIDDIYDMRDCQNKIKYR